MNIRSFHRLRCGECHEIIKYKEFVYLDSLNTVTHLRCYKMHREIRDKGSFHTLVNKYSFFDQYKLQNVQDHQNKTTQ